MEENKRKQDLEDEMTRFVLLFSFLCLADYEKFQVIFLANKVL